MIKIRPHHLICMQLYIGKGYSPDFNINMKCIISRLEDGEEFKLTDSADSICLKCTNLKKDVCRDSNKVVSFDKGVYDKLSLDYSKQYSFDEIKDVSKVKDILETVCAACSWNETCRNILKNKSEVQK